MVASSCAFRKMMSYRILLPLMTTVSVLLCAAHPKGGLPRPGQAPGGSPACAALAPFQQCHHSGDCAKKNVRPQGEKCCYPG